jgi:hypothetical protein
MGSKVLLIAACDRGWKDVLVAVCRCGILVTIGRTLGRRDAPAFIRTSEESLAA